MTGKERAALILYFVLAFGITWIAQIMGMQSITLGTRRLSAQKILEGKPFPYNTPTTLIMRI